MRLILPKPGVSQLPVRIDRQAIALLSYKIAGAHIRNAYMLKRESE